jgi:hypothetical protein
MTVNLYNKTGKDLKRELDLARQLADKRRPHEDPMMHREAYSEGPEPAKAIEGYSLSQTVERMKALKRARDQLNKETERGEHKPAVGGFSDHKHGGES